MARKQLGTPADEANETATKGSVETALGGVPTATGRSLITAADKAAARAAIGSLLSGARSPMLGAKIRGGNITTKPAYQQWDHFWADWDWDNWIKPQIDRATKLGLNTIRLIGGPLAIFADSISLGFPWAANSAFPVDYPVLVNGKVYQATQAGTSGSTAPSGVGSAISDGTVTWRYLRENNYQPITQAQYDARWVQLVEYCGQIGMNVYPCLCTTADFTGTTFGDADVNESITTTASVLSRHTNVIGFDVFQEGDKRTSNGVAWAANRSYSSGTYAINAGKSYLCVTSGTSASSGGGPTATSSSISDGTVVWSYAGVPLFKEDVLALMARIRGVCSVPLTMSTTMFGSSSQNFYAGTQYINFQVNADPAGVDFVDLHIYEPGITPKHAEQYLQYFGKPALVGEFGTNRTVDSSTQVQRYTQARLIHARPDVAGSLVWALADQGVADNQRLFGCWDNTGFQQANNANSGAPLSTEIGQRQSLVSELRKFVTANPAVKTGVDNSLVSLTQLGGTGAENGANTWAKIATANSGGNAYTNMTVLLGVTQLGSGFHDSAIISVQFAENNTGQNPTVGVSIIAKGGDGSQIAADSFKVISDGFGTDMQLWMKKGAGFGAFAVYELSRGYAGNPVFGLTMLQYEENPGWQSATPTGTVNNSSSNGVTAFGVPVVSTTGTQTLTNKTLTSPTLNTPTLNTPTLNTVTIGGQNSNHLYLSSTNAAFGWRVDTADLGLGSVPLRMYARRDNVDIETITAISATGVVNFPRALPQANGVNLVDLSTAQTLTNKTLTSPTLTTPALGTPVSGNLANCTFPTLNQNTTGSAAKLTTARTIDGVSFDGSAAILTTTARLLAPAAYTSGQYYFCNAAANPGASATLGNGTVRLTAWLVTQQFTLSSMFCEFTAQGDSTSVFRIGIWSDDGTGKPGTVFLDAGTVSTFGTAAVMEITGLSTVIPPGLYWVGGAVQGVTSVQPTMRVTNTNFTPFPLGPLGASLPAVNTSVIGFSASGQTGAFSTISSPTVVGSAARIGFKVT
jgi:hypothetical protein